MRISADDTSDHFYLGIDGGGSKTLAIVVDAQGRERGRGLAGCANYNSAGLDQAVENIHAAVEQAMQTVRHHVLPHKAWLGIAGIDRTHDHDTLFPRLRTLAQVIHLTNDAELVLSALENALGVALIAGTGSIALGRNAHGTTARAGGWGHIVGDEGSGYDMGRQGLQAALRAIDGRGQKTILLELFLKLWNLDSADDLLGQIYPDDSKARIAGLSTHVLRAAREGDEVARTIVQRAADELALAVKAVSDTLGFAQIPVPLALGGGILLHEPDFRRQVLNRIGHYLAIGQVLVVEQPALSAARAAINLPGEM